MPFCFIFATHEALLIHIIIADSICHNRSGPTWSSRADQKGGGKRGGFSLSNLTSSQKDIPDSLLVADSAALNSKRITAYRLTPSLGEAYVAPLDTNKLNFSNSTLVESKSLAIGYLANLGAPGTDENILRTAGSTRFYFAMPTITISQRRKTLISTTQRFLIPTFCTPPPAVVRTKKNS